MVNLLVSWTLDSAMILSLARSLVHLSLLLWDRLAGPLLLSLYLSLSSLMDDLLWRELP